MLIQEVAEALGVNIIGADLTKQIATFLDSEDLDVRNR